MDNNKACLWNKDIVTNFKSIDKMDLHGLLEFLNTNPVMDIQVRAMSVLAAYLMSNVADKDVVVTCSYIYDKVCAVLAHCQPRQATDVLNFVTALVYADEERVLRNRPPCARNLIRASGCLATMCELFRKALYLDTWRSLCRSLAEACSCCEANQSYCSHLVPMCVKRCSERSWEVFPLLHSLLQNHPRNIQMFFQNNGDSLFTRDFLQHEKCLELVASILQSWKKSLDLIDRVQITSQLQEFLHLYGPGSQTGQWATIILYYTRNRVSDEGRAIIGSNETEFAEANLQHKSNVSNNDTNELFQNVIKEVVHWEPKLGFKQLQNFLAHNNKIDFDGTPKRPNQSIKKASNKNNTLRHEQRMDGFVHLDSYNQQLNSENETNELSFSFLFKKKCPESYFHKVAASDRSTKSLKTTETITQRNVTTQTDLLKSEHRGTSSNISPEILYTADYSEFKPILMSTPKHRVNNTCRPKTSMSTHCVRRSIQKANRKHSSKQRVNTKHRITKQIEILEDSKADNEIKSTSVSGRFFRAMNESCTTLVKAVKNIFGSNKKHGNSSKPNKNAPCSYSFTNYMKKRDAVFGDKTNHYENFTLETSNSCNTCNDTAALKNKLANNDFLKQTIKKLKFGINLFGCDFKKISRTMWPQDTYMTPTVLYNLYRKLIIK